MEDFRIDWSNPMAMFTSDAPPPQPYGKEKAQHEDDNDNGNDDDCGSNDYHHRHHHQGSSSSSTGARLADDGPTAAGAVQQHHHQHPPHPPHPHRPPRPPPPAPATTSTTAHAAPVPPTDVAKRLENQRRADVLRAKLLASRQNTPAKPPTPAKPAPLVDTPTKAPVKMATPPTQPQKQPSPPPPPPPLQQQDGLPITRQQSAPELDVEALLAAGKAHADAHIAAAAKEREGRQASSPAQQAQSQPATGINGTHRRHAKDKDLITGEPVPRREHQSTESTPPPAKYSTNLADSYYTDLAAWLDLTGYHDVDYRSSKLRTYKERRALEEEAARIAEKLEQLRQAEQAEMPQLRIGTPTVKPPNMAPPPLPQSIDVPQQLNGAKRGRSPETTPVEKRQRKGNGFRIRGVKESPDGCPVTYRRGRSPSPGYERRGTYSGVRRRSSIDERGPPGGHSRDPSLERRAQYYRREDDLPRYDHYTSRDPVSRESRLGHNATNGFCSVRPGGRELAPSYRPSASLELKKGGVRYFMIKSWNMDNVLEAQRTNIWATQEKNEEMLTHAFKTARHVILLFSVNNSMAFQGCALMTSAPDPKIQKPFFTSKLNWATSSAFTLRWLAKTPIHFKLVGHLKNTLNYDEEKGEPHTVVVGKDGQEINADAGMGVVLILDDAEGESRSGRL